MPVTTLPNGIALEAPSANEARILYRELFETNGYLRNGITVSDGDTVLDVGANVGAFSIALAQEAADLRLLLFEPVPDTFAMLQRNAARLLTGARATLVNAGLGAASGRTSFVLDPWSSFMAMADTAKRQRLAGSGGPDLLARTRAALADGARAGILPPRLGRAMAVGLRSRVLRPIVLGGIRVGAGALAVARRLRAKRVVCEITTLSDVLRDHRLDIVHLVKIDVEGAEWDVLRGVDDADWPKLRQLALEVHDVDGRVGRIRDLLESNGYQVVVEAADWETLRLEGVHNIFAMRP